MMIKVVSLYFLLNIIAFLTLRLLKCIWRDQNSQIKEYGQLFEKEQKRWIHRM